MVRVWLYVLYCLPQSLAVLKGDAEDSRLLAGQLGMEAERARQAEVEAQQQAAFLEEALESLRHAENPHLQLHQLQLLHRLPLSSICSLQAQICSCLRTVEQVITHNWEISRSNSWNIWVLISFKNQMKKNKNWYFLSLRDWNIYANYLYYVIYCIILHYMVTLSNKVPLVNTLTNVN